MPNTDFGSHYFSRKPYESFYFWVPTIWLLVAIVLALLVGERFYIHRHSREVIGGLWWMCLSVAGPVILWIRTWRSHSKLYQLNLENRSSNRQDEGFNAVLAQAASLEYAGLFIALLVLQSALIAFSKVLGK